MRLTQAYRFNELKHDVHFSFISPVFACEIGQSIEVEDHIYIYIGDHLMGNIISVVGLAGAACLR